MRLSRLSAWFGVLNGTEICFEPETLQLIIDDNERGKSTVVAAIVAALYGLLPGSRGVAAEQLRYRPLSGDRFEVELDLAHDGRQLRIRRDFARGSCTVADLDTVQDLTARFQSGKSQWEIGQALLGLNREQFLRTALVRQGEISELFTSRQAGARQTGKARATLTSRIQQLVDSNAGDHTADAAIQALEAALRGYDGVTFKGIGNVASEIKVLQERITSGERRLEALRKGRAELDTDAGRMVRLHAEAAELRQRRDHESLLAERAEARLAAERLHQDAERRARLELLTAERQSLAELAEVDPRLAGKLAALDGAIGACDRQLRELQPALDETADRNRELTGSLATRTRFEPATPEHAQEILHAYERLRQALDAEAAATAEIQRTAAGMNEPDAAVVEARFEQLSPDHEDELNRYGERRSELLVELAEQPGSQDEAPRRSRAMLLCGGGLTVAGVVLLLLLPLPGLLLALAGGGLILWSLLRPPSLAPAVSLVDRDGSARAEIERRLRLLDDQVTTIARELGYDTVAAALSGLRAWQQTRGRREQLRAARRMHDELAATLLLARQAAAAVLVLWQRSVAERDLDPGLLLALHDELNSYLQDRQTLALARSAEAALRERTATDKQERDAIVAAFAESTGCAAETPEQRAVTLERIGQQLAGLQRRQELDAQLGELRAGLLPDAERSRLEPLAARLKGAVVAIDEGQLSPAAHRDAMARLANEADERGAEARTLEAKLAVALNDFEREHPATEQTLEHSRAALARACSFEAAAVLARNVLTDVAREAHRDWSRRLNVSTGAILDRFATEHAQLRFGEQLEFVVRDGGNGREWSRAQVDHQLSAGARDQIYLAIRFALADYFSLDHRSPAADPLPLILDDPLMSSDDHRFAAIMSYLTEQAAHRQVIVLTCHAERHRSWLRSLPPSSVRVSNLTPSPVM